MADGDGNGNDTVKTENVTRDMTNQQENNRDLAIINNNNEINDENINNNDAVADDQRQKYQPSKWESFFAVTKSLIIRSLIIYFITSFFRRPTPDANGTGVQNKLTASNLFDNGTLFDLYIYLSESENFNNYNDNNALIWHEKNLIYGDWYSGNNNDGSREFIHKFTPSKQLKNNGSIYIHVYAIKSDKSLLSIMNNNNNNDKLNYISYSKKMLNKYKKIKYQQKHNLLTGETTATQEQINKAKLIKQEIVSHWHDNITINMVTDWTNWIRGQVAQPFDDYIEFTNDGNYYKPVLFFNDFWNMNRDYYPLNNTIKQLEIRITYQPLSLFKWQLYSAQLMKNKWTASSLIGDNSGNDEDDNDQDTLKETILETNIYLLGATIFISIFHSIFEFLAFKNDIQFWNNRKSLEGLSVRSVFFNVFQSLIVLLYVFDNESNTMIRISCAIGLCIEIWKINKVIDIRIDKNNNNKIFGIIPRIIFNNKSSYTESSTKEYDRLAFRYLSWALYPLLIGYALYSLMYLEHKGWYSWVLNMLYGFLLTFGFIMMTPQLFINYKLKSVAHLPWRMMSYKFLNTFIDDIFAFVIKMPTLYRLGCFRDDIVFFIFLYQRWIYKIDLSRVNEFGYTGETTTTTNNHDDDNNAITHVNDNNDVKSKDKASKKSD